jgi:hypothetical protein
MMRGDKKGIHYILAAGQTIGAGEPNGDIFIIPNTNESTYIENVTYFELEHILTAWYDAELYEANLNHSHGTGHPFLPTCPPPRVFPTSLSTHVPFAETLHLVK